MLDGVGPILARRLIAYSGGVEAVFKQKKQALLKVPGVGAAIADKILKQDVMKRAEAELVFMEKNQIESLYFLDENYPRRLKELDDSPILIFCKGKMDLNAQRIISIVGTRKATDYGKMITEKIVEGLAPFQPLILSGLAYGIDVVAHRAALSHSLQTVGVVGHGLDMLYPSQHKSVSEKMMHNGGVISAYASRTKLDPSNFPDRNRVVASMTDAVVVIEASKTGGALITANLANEYNRDVMAVPGRANDIYSEGCNSLIKRTKAHLVESAEDVCYILGWELDGISGKKSVQKQLFIDLTSDEQKLADLLQSEGTLNIDIISIKSGFTLSQSSSTLFGLEMKGVVKSMPGAKYALT